MNSLRSRRIALTLLLVFIALLSAGELWAQKTTTTMTGIIKAAEMYGTKVRSVYIRIDGGDDLLVARGTRIGKELLGEVGTTVKATGYLRESRSKDLDFANTLDVLEYEIVPAVVDPPANSAE